VFSVSLSSNALASPKHSLPVFKAGSQEPTQLSLAVHQDKPSKLGGHCHAATHAHQLDQTKLE
jgi:hypothetical protein